MIKYYKLVGNSAEVGVCDALPLGGVAYAAGAEPQELIDALAYVPLEDAKANKLLKIQEDFITSEETPVVFTINTVEYSFYGGSDSVNSIDQYVRLMQLAGAITFDIWDTNGTEHSLTLSEVQGLMLTIGSQASVNKFTKKNRKVAVELATTLTEVAVC